MEVGVGLDDVGLIGQGGASPVEDIPILKRTLRT
jgi:hypothetical protein